MHKEQTAINSIVLLRAIAALGVCFIHIKIITGLTIDKFADFIIDNGQQGVVIFFVISGFILPYSLYKKSYQIKDFFIFFLKRIIRVDPPYWCSIVLFFIFIPLPISLLNINSVFYHLMYIVPFIKNAHWFSDIYWTLSIEFQFYILLGLCYPLLIKLKNYISVCIIISVGVLCLNYSRSGIIIGSLYQFGFGYLAFMAYVKIIEMKRFWVIIILFTTIIIFSRSIISGVVPACAVLFILLYRNNNKVPVLNPIGDISYSLYLVHIPVSVILVKLLAVYVKSPIVLFPISLICSILFAWIFNFFIEKPVLALSKKIVFKHAR